MKRILITFLGIALVAGLIAPGISSAQSPAATGGTRSNPVSTQPGNAPEVSPSRRPCIYIEQNLGYGEKDRMTNGSVMNYQVFLKLHGYLFVEPTGYFGPLTLAATKAFQKAFGIPTTGFVGPLTRAQMKKVSCADDMPTPVSKINITIPNGGEILKRGSKTVISWIGSEKVDIKLKSYIVCITTPCEGAKYTIRNNYSGNSLDWTVGTLVEKIAISEGNYQIEVCETGTTKCDTSDGAFTISDTAASAPAITSISPASGKVGSKVTINGTGFTSTSAVRFGGGYISRGSVMLTDGRLEFTLLEGVGLCNPYTSQICAAMLMQITPNTYVVVVENADGTKSNQMNFKVTQ
ncbi:MAG: peptidoglycan-binding protein [bacterium]|nr:peptidoglycan-binding protein [bacterium]